MEPSTAAEKKPEEGSKISELDAVLKQNQDLIDIQKKSEEAISSLKKEKESKKEEIKSKNNAELFDLIISELKDYIKSQDETQEIAKDKERIQNEINNAYYKAQQASERYDEIEKYNTEILSKIKAINEEKAQIEEKLKQNYESTKEQCEKFKEEYQKKFDEISNEAILKENEDLKVRIKECEENTNKIKQNINEQMEMRKKQSDDLNNMLKGQIGDKLSEINKETDKYEEENKILQKEIDIEKAKFGDDPDLMKGYNKKFDKAKKEYEKTFRDYLQISQEHQKLKELDPVSIQKEIDSNKAKLDALVKSNKELQAKIKELKNKKNNEATAGTANEGATEKKEDNKKEEEKKEEVKKEEDKKDEDKKEEEKKEEDKKEENKKEEESKKEEDKKEDNKKEEDKKEEDKKE